jgi:restriction system protein
MMHAKERPWRERSLTKHSSTFSNEAREYAKRIESRIILIDGDELSRLMILHGVGVTPIATYELKRIDSDYFLED